MQKNYNLTEGNILPCLLRFTLPVLCALFLQALYGGVDLLIVGQFAATADVSGVATSSSLTAMLTQVITGLSTGITVLVGEIIGQEKPEKAAEAIGNGICLFAAAAVLITLVLVVGAEHIASLLCAPEEAYAQTVAYIRICGFGAVFIVAYNVLGAIFRGLGDSNTPLLTVAIACVCNIAGDLLFVAGLHLGAAGAAAATVMAQGLSVLISLFFIRRRTLPFTLTGDSFRLRKGLLLKELRLGAPIALQEIFVGSSFMFIQAIVNSFGVTASAGVGVAEKVSAFVMLVPSAYMQSMSAFVAQNLGAGNRTRSRRALKLSLITAFAVGVVMLCLQYFGGGVLSSLFTNDTDVISASHSYLRAYAIDSLISPMMFCFIGYFNGCEKSLFVMVQGLIGAIFVRMPIVYLVSRIPGATLFMLGLGTVASSCVQMSLCVGYDLYLSRRTRTQD